MAIKLSVWANTHEFFINSPALFSHHTSLICGLCGKKYKIKRKVYRQSENDSLSFKFVISNNNYCSNNLNGNFRKNNFSICSQIDRRAVAVAVVVVLGYFPVSVEMINSPLLREFCLFFFNLQMNFISSSSTPRLEAKIIFIPNLFRWNLILMKVDLVWKIIKKSIIFPLVF